MKTTISSISFIIVFVIITIDGQDNIYITETGLFRVHKITGDGNCAFRAISYVVWGTEGHHDYLRNVVVNKVLTTWERQRDFVFAEWNITDMDEYSSYMSKDATYASEYECLVATKLQKHNLAIYKRSSDTPNCLTRIFTNKCRGCKKNARLLFRGKTHSGHYDVLKRVETVSETPRDFSRTTSM